MVDEVPEMGTLEIIQNLRIKGGKKIWLVEHLSHKTKSDRELISISKAVAKPPYQLKDSRHYDQCQVGMSWGSEIQSY